MPTIREVVEALSRRPGVDAVVVAGRDGLPIDSHTANGVDPDTVAALVPSAITSMTQLGDQVSLPLRLAHARAALADTHAPVDGMLLDLHLPDGSGLDLLRELRAAATTERLPVIVLTAEGEERVLREAGRLGAELLTK